MHHLERLNLQAAPSEALIAIYRSIGNNPEPQLQLRIAEMGQRFCKHYSQSGDGAASETNSSSTSQQVTASMEFAKQILENAECLYYKLLENILISEKEKHSLEIPVLLENQMFHRTLFACCLEIVIHSSNSQRMFPWILDVLRIKPYHFYKVIEPIVSSEEKLTRSMVKHLNLVEEQILESMAWKNDSPIWDALAESGLPVPSNEDVSLPGQLSPDPPDDAVEPTLPSSSPLHNPLDRGPAGDSVNDASELISVQGENEGDSIQIDSLPSVESVSTQEHHVVGFVQAPGEHMGTSSQSSSDQLPTSTATPDAFVNTDRKPKRTGSLGLFLRKFYHLALIRMEELCKGLHLEEKDTKRKLWTLFEHIIINHIDLMCDRHADQILICSVYLMCEVTKNGKSMTDIWECYKKQPQSNSLLYSSVLISSSSRRQLSNGDPCSVNKENQEESDLVEARSDLYTFYISIYEPRVIGFAHRLFGDSLLNDNLKLSPLPRVRFQSFPRQQAKGEVGHPAPYFRRLSKHHPVYIRSLGCPEASAAQCSATTQFHQSPITAKQLSYVFNSSPTEELRAINHMIRESSVDTMPGSLKRVRGKRLLADDPSVPGGSGGTSIGEDSGGAEYESSDSSESSLPKQSCTSEPPIIARKIQDMLRDRMGKK